MIRSTYYISMCLLAVLWASSCGRNPDDTGTEYAPDMYHPESYEPYKQRADMKNKFNPYGNNLWYPVTGTVSRRNYQTTYGSGDSAVTDLMVYNLTKDDLEVAASTLKNPVPGNEAVLEEGKVLYTRYCKPCHGEQGKGDGPVGKVYKGVPNYSVGRYKEMNDGHIFHVITYGRGRMWPHGTQILPPDRWKIVHYVHQLQQQP